MDENLNHGTGAIKDKVDDRDNQYSHIAFGTPEFDWTKGYDVEDELTIALGLPAKFKLASKDQNGSGSCGGQAWSYYSAVLEAFATKTYEERSAKFIYSQTHSMPAGSAGRDNCNLVINKGCSTEELCKSYDNGMPPGEAFMQRISDITADAISNAKLAKELIYANVATNIDLMAQAVRDNHGIVIGVSGFNNGTWSGMYPQPPKSLIDVWNHWLYVGKVKMVNGKKYLGIKNSWGDSTGDHGWQWLSEDYFQYYPDFKGYAIWSGWTMVFKGSDPTFKHTFNTVLKKGSYGDEVVALQTALNLEGMFKGKIDGHFGPITLVSVINFQMRYSLTADGVVGPKTNVKLNSLYGI